MAFQMQILSCSSPEIQVPWVGRYMKWFYRLLQLGSHPQPVYPNIQNPNLDVRGMAGDWTT